MNESIVFKIAETEEEKLGAYQVRYECLTVELGDTKYANHEAKTFIDPMDKTGKPILLVAIDTSTNKVVATQRITFRKDLEFTADYLYNWNELALTLDTSKEDIMKRAVLHDRCSTLKEYRNLKPALFTQIFIQCESIIAETLEGNGVMVAFISDGNAKVAEMAKQRLGMEYLANEVLFGGNTFRLYYKCIGYQKLG